MPQIVWSLTRRNDDGYLPCRGGWHACIATTVAPRLSADALEPQKAVSRAAPVKQFHRATIGIEDDDHDPGDVLAHGNRGWTVPPIELQNLNRHSFGRH